jgi:DNA primase
VIDRGADRNAEKNLVKERVALRDVVAEVVGELRSRGGDDLWACCPFHHEDTPSFHIRPALGVFKCFGCGESGDVISFVMKTRGIGFREALEALAERAGIELGSLSPEDKRRQAEARRSRQVLDVALQLFRRALAAPGNAGLQYMRQRGFSAETLQRFDIGFIPPDFLRGLRAAAPAAGLPLGVVEGAGFTLPFAGRVGFGIRDGNGSLVGFGARRLSDDGDGPKYVNTRETAWFSKGRLLYGLDKANRPLARTRRLVVMEGYTDVMMAHQAGLDEAVATMGTSFTAEHLRLVKARVGNLVLVFDGDEPGCQAAERASRMVLAEGLECRVLLLPSDMDPCDWFATRTRADFDALLDRTGLSSVAFLCRRGLERLDVGQPGGREQVAREMLELTRTIEDPLRRETIVGDIARACGLDRNLLRRGSQAAHGPSGDPGALSVAERPGTLAGASRRPVNAPVKALVRSQFVAVAGLAQDGGRLQTLAELERDGALDHPGARQLLALGRALLEEEGCLDAGLWLEAARERAPAEHAALERALLPPPGLILPGWDEAVAHLRGHRAGEAARAARRDALLRPDIASNGDVLRGVQASLRGSPADGGFVTGAPQP